MGKIDEAIRRAEWLRLATEEAARYRCEERPRRLVDDAEAQAEAAWEELVDFLRTVVM